MGKEIIKLLKISLLVTTFFFVLTSYPIAAQQIASGTASGSLTIDKKSIKLNYSYAMEQPNTFDDKKTDIAILLTENAITEDDFKDVEDLNDVAQKYHGWAFFKIDNKGNSIYEMIDHPSLGGKRLTMSGFTNAKFIKKVLSKDRIEGTFKTDKMEDFSNYKYQINVSFNSVILQAKRPEPLPDAKTGKKLPAGGGEPGKAYMSYHNAIMKKDIKTLRKLAPSPEEDRNLTDKEINEMLDFMALLSPKNPKITAGYISNNRAVLYLTGTVEGEKQYGTVEMILKEGTWRVHKESWSNTPPKR